MTPSAVGAVDAGMQAELDCATRIMMAEHGLPRVSAAHAAAAALAFTEWYPECHHSRRHALPGRPGRQPGGAAPVVTPIERDFTLVFDLDGTLIQTGARIDYEDAATFDSHCRPYLDAWRRVRACLAQGHRIVFLTARGQHLRDVTHLQVLKWGGSDLYTRSEIILRERPAFDWGAYVEDKADKLRQVAADLYVGDRDEDQTAAAMEGVCFLRAEAWRAGIPWEPIYEAEPGSAVRVAAACTTRRAMELGVMPALQAVLRAHLRRSQIPGSNGTSPGREPVALPTIGLNENGGSA